MENADFLALVFPYIEGETLGDAPLTLEQIRQLAQLLAALHGSGFQPGTPVEDRLNVRFLFWRIHEAYLSARICQKTYGRFLYPMLPSS